MFHILRRQVHREFRKPLIVMEPKSLLRHPLAVSSLEQMGPGTRFLRFIPEQDKAVLNGAKNEHVRRLILCSGKVYYDLLEERQRLGITDVALARVEQVSPFPHDLVHRHADNFPNAEIVWCQVGATARLGSDWWTAADVQPNHCSIGGAQEHGRMELCATSH
jgi:2-oxoglutarate dehydrogenase E1 component